MEAKDGSCGFDFAGVYDNFEEHNVIDTLGLMAGSAINLTVRRHYRSC